jgi:hypothetical protein
MSMGVVLLLFSMVHERAFEFRKGYERPTLVSAVISVLAVLPLILPLFILIHSFPRNWVLSPEPTKTTDLNGGLPYDPTLPQRRWFPKISPYRLTVFLTPLAIGTAKAVLRSAGSITTPNTVECIVIFLV